jgi:hypothetical protein
MMSKAPTTSYSVGDCERMSNEDLVAEVSRLRRLVEEAYVEGYGDCFRDCFREETKLGERGWPGSVSFRKLNPEDKS